MSKGTNIYSRSSVLFSGPMSGSNHQRQLHHSLPTIASLTRGSSSTSDHHPAWPLSPPYSVSSEGYMKRQRTSASPSPPRPAKKGKETEKAESMASMSASPPGPSHTPNPMAPVPPSRDSRMSIGGLLSSEPQPPPRPATSGEIPLTYLAQDDPCVRQPFEVYLTYSSALSWRREELNEIENTLAEAESLIHDLGTELDRAENAKPRRARIIGPIRARLQAAETQRSNATEKVEVAKVKVAFSLNTMRAMQSVLNKFGWLIQESEGETSTLMHHPQHPALRNSS